MFFVFAKEYDIVRDHQLLQVSHLISYEMAHRFSQVVFTFLCRINRMHNVASLRIPGRDLRQCALTSRKLQFCRRRHHHRSCRSDRRIGSMWYWWRLFIHKDKEGGDCGLSICGSSANLPKRGFLVDVARSIYIVVICEDIMRPLRWLV